jgi:hypothetical protein
VAFKTIQAIIRPDPDDDTRWAIVIDGEVQPPDPEGASTPERPDRNEDDVGEEQ